MRDHNILMGCDNNGFWAECSCGWETGDYELSEQEAVDAAGSHHGLFTVEEW